MTTMLDASSENLLAVGQEVIKKDIPVISALTHILFYIIFIHAMFLS